MSNISQTGAKHGFLLLGKNDIFGCHLPMFFASPHAFQMILKLALNSNDLEKYNKIRKDNPEKPLIIMSEKTSLDKLANSNSFIGDAFFANADGDPIGNALMNSITVTIKKNVLFVALPSSEEYPEKLTYYLYGKNSEFHISHVITKAPNFQQEADVTLSEETINIIKNHDSELVKISIPSLDERNKQPIIDDPIIENEYSIGINGDIDNLGSMKIVNKYWINNESLNMTM